jgi:regulator of sigma E protease
VIPATLTPELDEEPTPVLGPDLEPTEEEAIQAKMGLIYEFEYVPVDPVAAIGKSFILPVRFVEGLGATFSSPENFAEGVGGPGSIVKMTSQAAEEGVAQVLILAGLLSITLGIMNLLPVPPLDGGQMVIAFAEMIRGGKRLSIRVQHAMSTIGFLLVLLLMLSTFALDIGRFTGSLEDPFEVNEDIVTD